MGRSSELFMEMREAEIDDYDYDYQYQQYLKESEIMASNDYVNPEECYLENLSIQQLEALLPAYYTNVDIYIRELIQKKRMEEDAKHKIDD